jgi:hypothetical protein
MSERPDISRVAFESLRQQPRGYPAAHPANPAPAARPLLPSASLFFQEVVRCSFRIATAVYPCVAFSSA